MLLLQESTAPKNDENKGGGKGGASVNTENETGVRFFSSLRARIGASRFSSRLAGLSSDLPCEL